ncbi:strictosidine synthase family protein [Alteromonas sp. PRIM-21]|uniref:strictosidine synthase family protein n=1 Tax=Alteromonas sp. PRIM-21 TaxID=1454978 RepID=UPI0022B9812C|nr:SMP-30/gluconolactonase/LRE family protein [Alteromonas sp. PRIM-21]MCZ8528582.1 SMP-30/gluconolactonase/LRE family protein [Alteromonas sp. PRIM-21]
MKMLWGSLILALAYLLLWPVPIDPVSWQAPKNAGFTKAFTENSRLAELSYIDIEGEEGPEDFAINKAGTIATATHSGAVLLMKQGQTSFTSWINTNGRPLGLEYDNKGNLLIADAHRGLLIANAKGELKTLVNQVENTPVVYADDVDIAKNGKVYFTDATTKFAAKDHGGTLSASLLEILEHKGNGRLIEYDPFTASSKVLIDGLVFANGVTMSHDQDSVLFNETGKYRVLRYWLNGPQQGSVEVVIDNLPGFPDNISQAAGGGYYLGLASPRSAPVDGLSDNPFVRKIIQRLPQFLRPQGKAYGHLLKISDSGKVLKSLQDPNGAYPFVTGAIETEYGLFISSLIAPAVGVLPHNKTRSLTDVADIGGDAHSDNK